MGRPVIVDYYQLTSKSKDQNNTIAEIDSILWDETKAMNEWAQHGVVVVQRVRRSFGWLALVARYRRNCTVEFVSSGIGLTQRKAVEHAVNRVELATPVLERFIIGNERQESWRTAWS